MGPLEVVQKEETLAALKNDSCWCKPWAKVRNQEWAAARHPWGRSRIGVLMASSESELELVGSELVGFELPLGQWSV